MSNNAKTAKKYVNYAITGILAILLISVCAAVVSLFAQGLSGKKPSLFNHRVYYIVTDSMTPDIAVGDVIISKVINHNNDAADIKVGDVITYIAEYGEMRGMSITHKVIQSAHYDPVLGRSVVTTQGVKAGATIDPPVPLENIEAVMSYNSRSLTMFYKAFTSTWGLVLMILLPFGTMLILMVFKLIMIIKQPSKADCIKSAEKERQEKIARIQQEAIQDYLDSNKKNE